jgi:cytidylate kinase
MKINIAIDGPSAAGKSTISKLLTKKLGYIHLDTGAMYRAVALKAVNKKISLDDSDAVCAMLKQTDIALKPDGSVWLDGRNVSQEIRTEKISLAASSVSRHPEVRKMLVKQQQEMASSKGFIMDGRDIGTVVLKDAELKIFMTATPEARAERRYLQDKAAGIETGDVASIAEKIRQRDYQDTHREASPLRKADDAVELDTSSLTIDQTVDAIYQYAKPYLDREV